MKTRSTRSRAAILAATMLAVSPMLATQPAHAFGFGRIV